MEAAPSAPRLLPSTTSHNPAHSPAVAASLPRSFLSPKTCKNGRSPIHGLGFLGSLPKDFSSLLCTGSLSRHNAKLFQEATAKLGRSGYADSPNLSSRPQSAHLCNMFSATTTAAEERPTRKLKKENRVRAPLRGPPYMPDKAPLAAQTQQFYNFLTRSRSRSRSKTDHSPPPNHDSTQLPHNGLTRQRSDSKPPHRLPSRPLSSTTTATNTTITPGTPKARKKHQSSIPVPTTRQPENTPDNANGSRPNTPSRSTNNRRKINFFGISITGPRRPSLGSSKSRSRSRSRPGTPRVSIDVPPLPTFGFEDESWSPPHLQPSRPASPSPPDTKSRAKQDMANTLTLASLADRDLPLTPAPTPPAKEASDETHTSSSKIRGFFSAGDSRRFRHRKSSTVPADLVSGPLKRVSSLQRQNGKITTDRPKLPADSSPSSPPNLCAPTSSIPRIIQTPATPVRAATVSGGTASRSATAPTSRSVPVHKNRSLDTGYRYRGTMAIVDEEGRLSKESRELIDPRISSKRKGKEKEKESEPPAPMPRNSISRMSASVRNTKHGSFDFERPGQGAVAIQRTGSNGTSASVTSGWSRSGEGVTLRESALGPGLAGVGTIQREASMKRGREREEKTKEMQNLAKEEMKKVAVEEPSTPAKINPSPAHSSNGHQTPPSGTTSGKSSSLSKASGRRFFGKGLPGTRTSAQHGLFSFEPPVPSPTWSTVSVGTTKEVSSSWGGRTEKEKERLRREKEKPLERKSSQRRDRSPVPVPLPNVGHRSGVKGRSLDLNLGLAWAPSKVREDALPPTSTLFHRSISNSSSVKSASGSRSANSSAHGHDPIPEEMTLEDKSKIGRETAELFRKALGEARYMRFKTYIYQFDAHEIPFDGPTGIISRVDALLSTVQTLGFDEKHRLMDKLVRIILQNA